MNIFTQFRQKLADYGLEYFNKYYGIYDGVVADNQDPEVFGRLKLQCQSVYGTATPNTWALPRGMYAGNGVGFYAIPQVGDTVWVSFRNGDTRFPVWEYGIWNEKVKPPKDAKPEVQIWQSTSGHRVELSDADGHVRIVDAEGNENIMTKDGVVITTAKGHKAEFDDTAGVIRLTEKGGNVFEIGTAHISVGSGTKAKEFAAMGETNLQLWSKFVAHQNVLLTVLVTYAGAQAGVASGVGFTAHLAAALGTLGGGVGAEIANLNGNIATDIPSLISTKVSID